MNRMRQILPAPLYDCVLEIVNMRRKRMGSTALPDLDDVSSVAINMIVEEILVANVYYANISGLEFVPVLKLVSVESK